MFWSELMLWSLKRRNLEFLLISYTPQAWLYSCLTTVSTSSCRMSFQLVLVSWPYLANRLSFCLMTNWNGCAFVAKVVEASFITLALLPASELQLNLRCICRCTLISSPNLLRNSAKCSLRSTPWSHSLWCRSSEVFAALIQTLRPIVRTTALIEVKNRWDE